MSVFRFRRFQVVNKESAMKVNTDGVLLGALMTIRPQDRMFLDIGTGTGTIALMAAQRISSISPGGLQVHIHAIDIDAPSALEAEENFKASPWSGILESHHLPLSGLDAADGERTYDRIFSNPPYFDESLQAPDARRNAARHSASLSYREISDFAGRRLSEEGLLSMVLPSDVEKPLLRHCRMNGLFPFRTVRVRTVPRKAPSRIIIEFSRNRNVEPSEEQLVIQEDGRFTDEYISATSDFYLWESR